MFCIMGFQTHMLPLSYNFHKYMVRSMEDEFHTIVRAAVENLADHSEIVCHDCRSRFVETIPSHPESPPSGTAEFVDEMALGSQFVQVLHLIAQVVCEEAEPPLVPQNCIDPPSDDDFLRIELDGWGNGNDNFAHEDWEDGESEYQSENENEEREMGISWPLWGYAILCIFINIHGLNIYFWLSFIPNILVLLVGTKLKHVVSVLALEIAEPSGPSGETQVKPRDALFWFGKPGIILRLIQFISFQVRKIITD